MAAIELDMRTERGSRGTPLSNTGGPRDVYYARMTHVFHPPTDVYEFEDRVMVKVEIAGMAEDALSIRFSDRRLVVSGSRQDLPDGADRRVVYHNMEIDYGEFRTEVQLNVPVDPAAIEATYEHGFLFVSLPRPTEHRVEVRTLGQVDARRAASTSGEPSD